MGNPLLQNGPLFLLVTRLLVSLEKRVCLHKEDEDSNRKDVFQGLLTDFWEGLGLLFVRYVDNEEADPQALEGIASLLQVNSDSHIVPTEIFKLTQRVQQINKAVRAILVLKSG